ncbi:MAG TPA: hypothetical protein VLA71_12080 [Algoriphagus sp.]|nr:hypothetical protein [Algoriphagus sp.]
MSYSLRTDQRFRMKHIVDDFKREALHIEIDASHLSILMVRVLQELRCLPDQIRVKIVQEFFAESLQIWTQATQVRILFIQQGKLRQNTFFEHSTNHIGPKYWTILPLFLSGVKRVLKKGWKVSTIADLTEF